MIPLSVYLAGPAVAANTAFVFCGTLQADYFDAGWSDTDGVTYVALNDDHFTDNSARAARGMLVGVHDNQANTDVFVRLQDESVSCPLGVPCACAAAALTLNTLHTYDVRLWADVAIGPNRFVVRKSNDPSVGTGIWTHINTTAWQPAAGNGYKYIVTNNHEAWRIAAAAGWALHRRSSIECEDTIDFYTQDCPHAEDSATSCQRSDGIFIDPLQDTGKYFITHEQGHQMSVCANEDHNDVNTGDTGLLMDGDCLGDDVGREVEKRDAGFAASEGIAQYWAAVAFNNTSESDCEYFRSSTDYNHNFIKAESLEHEKTPSCEGDSNQDWAEEDYIDAHCNGTMEDHGTILDYLRAFWDAEQGQGLTTAQVFRIYADANPHTWDADGGGITNNDDVQERLEGAAAGISGTVGTKWNNVDAANGIR